MLAKGNALGPGDRLIQNQRGKPSNLASLTSKFLTAMPLKDDAYPLFKLEFYLLSTQVASKGEGRSQAIDKLGFLFRLQVLRICISQGGRNFSPSNANHLLRKVCLQQPHKDKSFKHP